MSSGNDTGTTRSRGGRILRGVIGFLVFIILLITVAPWIVIYLFGKP